MKDDPESLVQLSLSKLNILGINFYVQNRQIFRLYYLN
jgi:hypothetical protein